MRISIYLLLITIFFNQTLKSQDYQLVNSKGYKLFEVNPHPVSYGVNNDVKSIKVDSIKLEGNDSIFFLNKELQYLNSNSNQCYNWGNSMLGKLVVVKSNGINVLINHYGDSIEINTAAKKGYTWTCFNKGDTSVIATIANHQQENILGILDSVKTISFKYSINNQGTTNTYDTLELKVSKAFGVVKIPNMNLFPSPLKKYNTNEMSNTGTIVYPYVDYNLSLLGDSRITSGAKNLEFNDLFNFKVGDEFHFTTNRNESISMGTTHHIRDSTIEVIIGIEVVADTINYKVDFTRNYWLLTNAGDVVTRTRDTVKFSVFNEFKYNALPYVPYQSNSNSNNGYINLYVDDNSKKILANELFYDTLGGTGCVPSTFGGHPLGVTLNKCFLNINPSNWTNNDGSDKTVNYYQSDCGEWGTKNILTSSLSLKKELIEVSPNPSKGLFKLSGITSQSDLVIFSSNGTIIKILHGVLGSTQIDLTGQSQGLYYCKIESKERVVFKKIVKF